MKTMDVTLARSDGLDAHGIALCVQTASKYESRIYLTDGIKRMNAKSIMGMMALGLALGDTVSVEADGPDEETACGAMAAFLCGN